MVMTEVFLVMTMVMMIMLLMPVLLLLETVFLLLLLLFRLLQTRTLVWRLQGPRKDWAGRRILCRARLGARQTGWRPPRGVRGSRGGEATPGAQGTHLPPLPRKVTNLLFHRSLSRETHFEAPAPPDPL